MNNKPRNHGTIFTVSLAVLALSSGCRTAPSYTYEQHVPAEFAAEYTPRELDKVSLPPYIIEPPDVLLIEAVKVVPKPPYKLEPLDVLSVAVRGTLPDAPIAGLYMIDADGTVNLGPEYGAASVKGLSIEEAKTAIEQHLKKILAEPQVSVEISQTHGLQRITGEHLVRLDGTVSLGTYGNVRVAGLTLEQAKQAIEARLALKLHAPEVYIDIVEYSSKVCYVITDGGGYGEQIARFTISGNETVLDVVSQINGVPPGNSKKQIWIARPGPAGACDDRVMPIDWVGITQRGNTVTNYQIMPGDRIYIHADNWVALANFVDKVTAPFERLFGFTLFGNSTIRTLQQGQNAATGGFGFGGGGGF